MPRKSLEIDRFDGGINDHADSRDLSIGQLESATDCNISERGTIGNMGMAKNATETNSATVIPSHTLPSNALVQPGKGLYTYSSDRSYSVSSNASLTTTLVTQGIDGVAPGIWYDQLMGYSEADNSINVGTLYMVIKDADTSFLWDLNTGGRPDDMQTNLYIPVPYNTTKTQIIDAIVSAINGVAIEYVDGSNSTFTATDSGDDVLIRFGTTGTSLNSHDIEVKFTTLDPRSNTITWDDDYDGNSGTMHKHNSTIWDSLSPSIGDGYNFAHNGNREPYQGIFGNHSNVAGVDATTHQQKITVVGDSVATTYTMIVNGVTFDTSSSESNSATLRNTLEALLDGSASNNKVAASEGSGSDMNLSGGHIALTTNSSGGEHILLTASAAGANYVFTVSAYASDIATSDNVDSHVVFGDDDGNLHVYHESIKQWTLPGIDINGTQSNTIHPSYYSDNSALRVCDSNYDNANQDSKWYGYINHTTLFNDPGTSTFSITKWATANNEVTDSASNYQFLSMGSSWNSGGNNATKLHLDISANSFSGTGTDELGWRGYYKFYVTALFDNGTQESLPITETSALDSGGTEDAPVQFKLRVRMGFCGNGSPSASTYIFPLRQSGVRIYFSKEEEGYGKLYALATIDFNTGLKRHDGGGVLAWGDYASSGAADDQVQLNSGNTIDFESEYLLDPYDELNGFNHDETTLDIQGWKTATISGRRCFVGNVKYNGQVFNDRMIVSPYNRFDIFPSVGIMDVAVNDGEEIIKLEAYADRVLQFKRNTLYIINVSQLDQEFVEDKHKFRGLLSPNSSTETQYGIAWVNEYGAYLYDGESITTLTEDDDGGRLIDEETWNSFVDENTIVGYYPKGHKLIIKKGCSGESNDGDVYVYHFLVNAWSFGDSRYKDSVKTTNFVTRLDGELLCIRESNNAISPNEYDFKD